MEDVIFGLVAVAAGALFCFRGHLAFRLVIPLWGAFVGFAVGAGAVAAVSGEGFLREALAWAVGLAVALLFALLAYFFYEVAVVIAMGSIGFALGATLMAALGVSWSWVIILAGLVLAVLLAFAAIAVDLPMLVLIVLSATGGASAITTGAMLLVGALDTAQFNDDAVTARLEDGWWWYALYLVLAVFGVVTQMRAADRTSRSMRESWAADRRPGRAVAAGG